MSKIILLVLLQAGVLPVLSQYNQNNQVYPRSRYSNDYSDDEYSSSSSQDESDESDQQQQDSSVGLQQSSFFDSARAISLVGGGGSVNGNSASASSYGGLTPPPPPNSGKHTYQKSERRIIVPSSLRELEESYIRSLSSPERRQPGFDPFGGNVPQTISTLSGQQQRNVQGVENYAGFIMTNRRLDRNQLREKQIQSAPITYGFPLLSQQQLSASNSIDALFGRKRMKPRGKVLDYREKNIVPNYPNFGDRPPVPQEPDIPSNEETEDAQEEATRKPPIHILPTPSNILNFFKKPSPPPLASPPPIFDPTFPEPVLQRGFIPSFGPPTKEPFFMHHHHSPPPDKIFQNILNVHEFSHNHLPSNAPPHAELTTTSPVPVLRPEYPIKIHDQNVLPDEVSSSIAPDPDLGPKEGKVFKHISIHVPSEDLDEELSSPRVIKVNKKPDKHIKVIFIKPPDTPTPKTEVEVPPTPQQKTLVYVLSESGGVRTPIKLVTPAPLKPAPPQVYFLRYSEPTVEANQTPPSTTTSNPVREREPTSEDQTERPRTPPPIKQLASPAHDTDAELLRSAPSPVLPTYSSFNNAQSTPVSRLAFHTINSPNLYTPTTANANNNNNNNNNNFENNDIGDPTNGRYQGSAPLSTSALPPITNNNNNNDNYNHQAYLQYTNANPNNNRFVPPSTSKSPPSQQNYYSALYHLYPPPVNSPNLIPLYYNQITHPNHPQFYPYLRDQLKSGSSPTTSSSIQGLYTVAPYLKDLPGSVNFNSLVQNPDGKNLPRSPRNYVMMTYAPNYMPSASEHVPVFTSPEAFLKSLLGDSYMYYNNTGNNSNFIIINSNSSYARPPPPTSSTTTTTTTTTTPAPPPAIKPQHHTFPLILNLENFQNLTRTDPNTNHQQPLTILIGSPYNLSPQTNTANIQIRNPTLTAAAAAPKLSSYSQLVPPFSLTSTSTSTTTSTTPQPRISWAPSTTPPPTPPLSPETTTTTRKDIYQLPVIIYNGNKPNSQQASPAPEKITTVENVASHFNNLFQNFHHNPAQIPKTNQPASRETIETSSEDSSSSVGSDETSGSGSNESSDKDSGSGEEVVPIFFEPTKSHVSNSSSIIYVKNNKKKTSEPSSSGRSRSSKRRGRKRVNPAHVKPGRRLRKVKKPSRSNRNNKTNDGTSNSNNSDSSSITNNKKETPTNQR